MSEETTETRKNDSITIKKDALWKYSTVVLAVALILIVSFAIPWKNGNVVKDGTVPAPTVAGPAKQVNAKVTSEDNFLKGNENSEVIIVEYSDFECPFCARAYSDAVAYIKENYDDNDVAFVYRHLPLGFHQQAMPAAMATECAAEQGKFSEMHDMLFELGVQGGATSFEGFAEQIGLDTEQYKSCVSSGKYESDIQEDVKQASSFGINGTPGFLVNGKLISGACPSSTFDQAIQAEMDGKEWGVTNCRFAEF